MSVKACSSSWSCYTTSRRSPRGSALRTLGPRGRREASRSPKRAGGKAACLGAPHPRTRRQCPLHARRHRGCRTPRPPLSSAAARLPLRCHSRRTRATWQTAAHKATLMQQSLGEARAERAPTCAWRISCSESAAATPFKTQGLAHA
eukprot:scaffold329751_cov63-Tisochrysis_lutea.AAC.2